MAATPLAAQLKQLAFAQQGVAGATKFHKHASLLFSEQDAQAFSLEELCEMGLTGFERLCTIHSKSFEPFSPLFGAASLEIQRNLQTTEENALLDKQISRFLRVLSPYMLLPAAHKCFEWLLRRFQIHMYNINATLEAILPFHGTALFARIILLLVFNDANKQWHFLKTVQQARVPLDRITLIRQCNSNTYILKFICKMVYSAFNNKPAPPAKLDHVTALYASIGAGSIASASSSDAIATLLPFLLRGLAHSHPDIVGANLIVAAQLAVSKSLSQDAYEAVMSALSQFNENDFGNQRLEAICLFCQTQQVKALPVSVRNAVLERETLQDDLISLSHTFSMDAFVSALIASLLDGSDDNVSQLLDLLPCMESCCGKNLDNVLQEHLSRQSDVSFNFHKFCTQRMFGVRFMLIPELDINILVGIKHDDASVRLASLQQIFESLQSSSPISDRDKTFIATALQSCLEDDKDDDVRMTVLENIEIALLQLSQHNFERACLMCLKVAFDKNLPKLALAATKALCGPLYKNSSEKERFIYLLENELLPKFIFRDKRFDTIKAIVCGVAQSEAHLHIPLFSKLETFVTALDDQGLSSHCDQISLNRNIIKALSEGVESNEISEHDLSEIHHPCSLLRIRAHCLALQYSSKDPNYRTLSICLKVLSTYMKLSMGVRQDDIKHALSSIKETPHICEAILPSLMQPLYKDSRTWTRIQRASLAVFAASTLNDLCCSLKASLNEYAQDALMCATECTVPNLVKLTLRSVLPSEKYDKLKMLSSSLFSDKATSQGRVSCLYLMGALLSNGSISQNKIAADSKGKNNSVDNRTKVRETIAVIPPALLLCQNANRAARQAAIYVLRMATSLLIDQEHRLEGVDADFLTLARQTLTASDDIISNSENVQQILGVILQTDRITSHTPKRSKQVRPFEAVLDAIFEWGLNTGLDALLSVVNIMRDSDSPARARVVLKHMLMFIKTTISVITESSSTYPKYVFASKSHRRRHVTSKRHLRSQTLEVASEALPAHEEINPEKALLVLESLASMFTATAAHTLCSLKTCRADLQKLSQLLLFPPLYANKCSIEAPNALSNAILSSKVEEEGALLAGYLHNHSSSGHVLASKGLLQPSCFEHLDPETQSIILYLLLSLGQLGSATQDTVAGYISQLPLSGELVADLLIYSFKSDSVSESSELSISEFGLYNCFKRKKTSKNNPTDSSHGHCETGIVTGFLNIRCLVDALQLSNLATIENCATLVPVLGNILLSYPTLNDENQKACQDVVQSIITVMIRLLRHVPKTDITDGDVDVDLIVKILGQARQSDMQNQALLLLAELARRVPRQVIACCMPIFAFLRQPFFQPDDDFTLQVLQRTIETIVPAIKEAATSKRQESMLLTDLCSVFVDSFYSFPHHRRRGLFLHLVDTVGVRGYLHIIVLLLMKKEVLDPRGFEDKLSNRFVAESSRVQRSRGTGSQIPSFVLSLCKALKLEDHLYAISLVIKCLLHLPVVSGSLHSAAKMKYDAHLHTGDNQMNEDLARLVSQFTAAKAMKPKHVRHWRYLLVNQVVRHVASQGVLRQLALIEQQYERAQCKKPKKSRKPTGKRDDLIEDEKVNENLMNTVENEECLAPVQNTSVEDDQPQEVSGGQGSEHEQSLAGDASVYVRHTFIHQISLELAEQALQLSALYRKQAKEAQILNMKAAQQLSNKDQVIHGCPEAEASASQIAGTTEYWRRICSDSNNVVQNIYAILALEDFIVVCTRLLQSSLASTQQLAVEMIAARIEAISKNVTTVSKGEVEIVMSLVPILAALVKSSSTAALASDEPLQDEYQLKLAQGAAHAIAVMAARYATYKPEHFIDHAASVLAMIDISSGIRTFSVAATCMASFAVLSTVLGPQLLPHFPILLIKLVDVLKTGLDLVKQTETAHTVDGLKTELKNQSDGKSNKADLGKFWEHCTPQIWSQLMLLLQSALDLAFVTVQRFYNMLTAKALEPLMLICTHPYLCVRKESPLPESLVAKAAAVRNLIAKHVPCRYVIETIPGCYSKAQALHKGDFGQLGDSLCALLELLTRAIVNSTPDVIGKHLNYLFRFFSTSMHFRTQYRACEVIQNETTASAQMVSEMISLVEGQVIEAVCSTVLQMSDATFRPYFIRLIDWASASGPQRVVTLARLVQHLCQRLKHVFVPYFSNLLRLYVRFLTNTDSCLTALGKDGREMIKFICHGLTLCFSYDRDGFISPERFTALVEALIKQLHVQSFSAAHDDATDAVMVDDEHLESREDYLQRISEDIIPCIVELADRGAEERQLQELNGHIISECNDSDPCVRLGALKLLKALYLRMGEELLPLLSETVSVFSELLEDPDSAVEREVGQLIKTVESHLNEPLSSYLRM